jgi:multidrug resistance protein, MATE family
MRKLQPKLPGSYCSRPASGALRGIKDTRMPMLITLVSYWLIGMPVALWLAFYLAHGPAALWWGLTAGLGVAAIGLSLRFNRKSYKTMRIGSKQAA